MSAVTAGPRTFAVDRGGRPARRSAPRGTTFRYTLSEPGRVTFGFERRAGRRVGSFTLAVRAGANATRFAGFVSGRALRPGSYRVTLTAVGVSGRASAAHRLRLRVIRVTRKARRTARPGPRA
jgi:hypothetical protein